MKFFIDTANLVEIEKALQSGLISGVTTNPSLLSKEPKGAYLDHMAKIVSLINRYGGNVSLSIEVFTNDQGEMVNQAKQFVKSLNYKNLAIKIPISYRTQNNLNVVKDLSKEGIAVNCTACMTAMQLVMAAAAGAKYISLFYNRLRDGEKEEIYAKEREQLIADKAMEKSDFNPNQVLTETRQLLSSYPGAEIIAGSIRTVMDVKQAGLAGAHIVTASWKILSDALFHFKTDDSVERFLKDFENWTTL